jgi:hypothetical protein
MTTTKYDNYALMLDALRELAVKAAGVEGADTIGEFVPIGKFGEIQAYGVASDLSEWLDDFADRLLDFLDSDEGDEIESWEA